MLYIHLSNFMLDSSTVLNCSPLRSSKGDAYLGPVLLQEET
jgi:hypothetical protein